MYECSVTGIRLAGGEVAREGRLEVKVAGRWGTVCDLSFNRADATVACYMLGYGYVSAYDDFWLVAAESSDFTSFNS